MNFFEQELRRLLKACSNIENPTFAGRVCYGNLGGDNRLKIQFIELGTFEKFEALKVSVLNRKDGEIDNLTIRLEDVWGRKNTTYKNLKPHIWTYNGKSEWYGYNPTDAEFKQLAAVVSSYLAVFTDHSLVPEKTQAKTGEKGSILKPIREPNQNTNTTQKTVPAHKKTDPEK